MERWKAHGWPCGLWSCCGTSIPMGLGYAVISLPGDPRSMTSTASSITTIGFTTCSSLPPWEGENYEPRNPVESGNSFHMQLLEVQADQVKLPPAKPGAYW